MEALLKLSEEKLQDKNQAQLRQILRRDFKYVKGTSVMEKDELVELIIQLRDERLEEVDQSAEIEIGKIYLDIPGNEWKVEKVEKGHVHIENAEGFSTKIQLTAFEHGFTPTNRPDFTEKPQPQVEAEVAPEDTVPALSDEEANEETVKDIEGIEDAEEEEEPVKEEKSKKEKKEPAKKSKSDLVRQVIRRQYRANEKLTSGTVMKELEDKHGLTIHRSFCSTILRNYLKTLKEADGK